MAHCVIASRHRGRPLNAGVRRHLNRDMRYVLFLGIAGLILGILGGLLGAATWFAAGTFVFGIALLSAYGYCLFSSEASETMEPYDIGEEPSGVAPAQAEEELRRKDRGAVRTGGRGAF